MRYIFSILFLFPTLLFSQTIDLRIPTVTTVGNTDSLNNKPASYYVDTATAQNIEGVKSFKNILNADSINITSQLTLNGVTADSMITLANATGNFGSEITPMDTGFVRVVSGDITFDGDLTFKNYTHHVDVDASSATFGSTAPTATTVGTFRGLGFNADAEVVYFVIDIPTDWVGTSDMTLVVHWYPTSGDVIANGETVKWDVTYRSIADGEAVDNGTAVTATATFTGGASETDKKHYETSITIDYDNANQPLTVGDDLGIQFDRDVSGDTYSGAGIVYRWDLEYTSNKLAEF